MATIILKNLYHNGEQVKEIIQNGDIIYVGAQKLVFDVDKDNISFEDTGGSTTIAITANDKWTMTKPEWITASQTSGTSTATITLSASATGTERTGNIVIACGGKTKTISVIQAQDYSKMYLTIEALEDGNFVARNSSLYYSINNGEWTGVITGQNIPLSNGDKVRFKGNSASYNGVFSRNTIRHKVYGNIESLLYGDNFVDKTSPGPLSNLFKGSSGLVDASNLVLPATTLAEACYSNMFDGCTSLTAAPTILPATTLALLCYQSMFSGCTSLTTAPELPATTLANYCYTSMFQGCTSLTSAPELNAPTLNQESYSYMFNGCTNLNYVKCLATNNSAYNCVIFWLVDVAASGTFVKKAGVRWNDGGVSGIPSGWTVIEE